MNLDEYRKSLTFLKKMTKLSLSSRESRAKDIESHLSRVIPQVEEWIKQRNFDSVQDCLAHLTEFDRALDFTALLGDYKFSYFIYINSAYVIQQ
jgi:hypothetical protein